MPKFLYTAIDGDGKKRKGQASAPNEEALIKKLKREGMSILKIEPLKKEDEAQPKKAAEPLQRDPTTGKMTRPTKTASVRRKDVAVFTRQLAATLNAGLPLLRIIRVIHSRCKKPGLKIILEEVGRDINQGVRFSDALAKHPGAFDNTFCNLIRVGEMGGSLPESVIRLADLIEKEMAIKRKVKSAMAYPGFILFFTTAMTYGLMAFLMPLFTPMFMQSGLDIENDFPLTHLLVKASEFVRSGHRMTLLLVLVVGGAIGIKLALRVRAIRKARDWFILKSVVTSGFVKQVVAARFSQNFSILLQSGVPLIQALDLVASAAGNVAVEDALRQAAKSIREGDGITDTIDSLDIFPDLLIQMSAMGEEAGSLPDMLERVADYYAEEVDASISALTSILEPVMMVMIGGVVGVFVMGILLPILAVSTNVQNQI